MEALDAARWCVGQLETMLGEKSAKAPQSLKRVSFASASAGKKARSNNGKA